VGATILECLDEERTVTSAWYRAKECPNIRTFDRFALALDLLFSLGLVDFDRGLLRRTV